VNAVAKKLYCPVCENVPLDVCPTQACEQWRSVIREKLSLGWTEDQVKQYFVDQYGDRVLATPPARGLNWLVYVLPPLAFVLGAGLLAFTFRKWVRSGEEAPEGGVRAWNKSDDPYWARLEEELQRRE
jgi:cytochrome c-type biogenesis protein CcmH